MIYDITCYTKYEINEIFSRFYIKNPDPKSELIYNNAYTLLIATLLSSRAKDFLVNKITKDLFINVNSPEKMINFGEKNLKEKIKCIGLWRKKSNNIISLSKKIINCYNGKIPKTRKELMSLPGVGRKTANIILNTIFNKKEIAVDTHIFRICNYIKLAIGTNTKIIEYKLKKIIPKKYIYNAHNWLILHGKYICQVRKKKCNVCIINDICKADIKF